VRIKFEMKDKESDNDSEYSSDNEELNDKIKSEITAKKTPSSRTKLQQDDESESYTMSEK